MGIVIGLGIGVFVSIIICGIAAFGGICYGIAKESLEEKEEKKKKENVDEEKVEK